MGIFTITVASLINLPPSQIGNNTLNILDPSVNKVLTLADFTTDTNPVYADPEGDAVSLVKITTLESSGDLELNNIAVTLNQEITVADINEGLLVYKPIVTGDYTATFHFDLQDIGSGLYSELTPGIMSLLVADKINLPPSQVGDNTINLDFGEALIITRAMLTSETTPIYIDPEADAASLLKIIEIPLIGMLELDGRDVVTNQVILFSDIDLSLFSYKQDDDGSVPISPSFRFSIADAGSGVFTE